MIGFHFPPSALSSGHLRMLAFARYLPDHGWRPVVLSAGVRAYERTDAQSVQTIPAGLHVHRAAALDAKRHLGALERYPSVLAQPDRWGSWRLVGIPLGLRLIRRYRVQAIWSTYPIMTAHCIGHALHRFTGLPWIADFRDPVTASMDGRGPRTSASLTRWERRTVEHASRCVFTTPGALRSYTERFPDAADAGRLGVIENGYDEPAFADLPSTPPPMDGRPLVLVHSGLLYPDGRNPEPFFMALARLKAAGFASKDNLKVVLRASGAEVDYQEALERLDVTDLVVLAPPVPRRDALVEQARADGLLLFQGNKYDQQIPAKLYEYMRIGRPIFALVGERGDTAALLRNVGGAELVAPDDVDAIAMRLSAFIGALRMHDVPRVPQHVVVRYSRREGAAALAELLDRSVLDRFLARNGA